MGTTNSKATKKITLATFKSFIKKNYENVYIQVKSDFDGMTDSIQSIKEDFKLPNRSENIENELGLEGIWLTHSKNYVDQYEDKNFIGYKVYNCCGSFIAAIKK